MFVLESVSSIAASSFFEVHIIKESEISYKKWHIYHSTMNNNITNNDSCGGKEQQIKKKVAEILTQDEINLTVEKFWHKTDRKKVIPKEMGIGPGRFHEWGTIWRISEFSPTLRLLKVSKICTEDNTQEIFQTVMKELDLEHVVRSLKTSNRETKAVVYEILSLPKWSFFGHGKTMEEAASQAAFHGIEFLIVLGS